MAIKIDSNNAIGTIGIDTETFAANTSYGMLYSLAGNDVITSSWSGPFVLGSGDDSLTATDATAQSGIFAYGAEGSDTILGASGTAWLWGGSGNDSLVGGAGDDRLYGDGADFWLVYCEFPRGALVAGVDTLSGGDGNDLLLGGELADQISGGAGSDLFVWEKANEFGDSISDFAAGAGGDVLFFPNLIVPNGATPNLSAYISFAQSGADTLMYLDRDGSADAFTPQLVATLKNVAVTTLTADHVAGFTSAPLYLPQAFMTVGSEWADHVVRTVDDLMSGDQSLFMPLYTLAGDDVVSAEFGGHYMLGDGNDRFTFAAASLPGGGGFDPASMFGGAVVDGGHGSDTLIGAAAADTFWGGSDNDSLSGGAGDDELFGDCGDQRVVFANVQDTVASIAGSDTINGGDGTDLIVGGGGADLLTGGTGSDLFVWENPNEFGDTITDFQTGPTGDRLLFNNLIVPQPGLSWANYVRLQQSGVDTLVYLDRDAGGTVYPEQLVVTLKGVSVSTLDASQLPGLTPGVHVLAPRQIAITSEWADTLNLVGAAQSGDPVSYYLLGGDDVVTSERTGHFSLGDGNDRFTAGTSSTLGALNLEGDAGNDTLTGGAGADDLTGGSGSDVLAGGGGDDVIRGDCGDSELVFCEDAAGAMATAPLPGGADSIDGGAGNDVIIGGEGADDLTGGTGSDLFVYENVADFGDVIRDFEAGASGDRILFNGLIQLAPGASGASYISLTQSGSDTLVWLDRDATGPLQPLLAATLKNVNMASISQANQLLLGEEARLVANDAPTASNATVIATEDTVVSGTLPVASDPNGDTVTYTKASDPGHGTVLVAAGGGYTYTPVANYSGSDSFTYAISDGQGGSNTYTVSVTVNAVNDPPVASAGTAVGNEDTVIAGTVLASDIDSASLTYSAVAQPSHGTVVVNANGSYTYTPAFHFNGADSFTFKANDSVADSNTATVSLTVNAVNDAPVASAGIAVGNEDTVIAGTVLASDIDSASLTYSAVAQPSHGTVVVNANGTYTYTPALNYNGPDAFTFKANDGAADSNTATVSLTVNAVNDAPVASAASASGTEDTALTGTVSASDVDSASLTYSAVGQPAHGTVVVNTNGSYTYTPALNYNGPDAFTFKANDGALDSNTATVSLTLAPVNDAPVVANPIADQSSTQGTAFGYTVPNNTFIDLDGDTLTYSAALSGGQPLPIWLTFNPGTRTFSGTPGSTDQINLSIRVTATDAGSASIHDDFILSVAAGQTISGTSGDDTLRVTVGNDTVNAGAGTDTVILPMFPNVFTLTESTAGHVGFSYAGYSLSLNDVEFVQFGTTFQTTIAMSMLVSGAAQLQLGRLTDLYLAFFGRAPDASGLEYWQENLLELGRDFATISKDFAWSPEAQALFPQGGSNRDFVHTVYVNCFGREPDAGGWDYWTAKLNGLGVTDLNDRGAFVGEVILGAYAPSSGEEDRSLLTNRHEAAMYYVNQLSNTPSEGFDPAINTLLTRVNAAPVTEDKAEHVIDYAFANPITLTGIMTNQPLLDSIWAT